MRGRRSSAPIRSRASRCARASSRRTSSIPRGSASMLERRSALEKDLQQGGHEGAKGGRGVKLGEMRGWSLVQASGFPDQAAAFEAALGSQLSAGLPAKVGDGVSAGGRIIMRVGPEHFWIVGPEKDNLAER